MTESEPISTIAPALRGPVVASQRWSRLTFVHWRIEASVVQQFMPPGVRADEHDGSSWVGLISFYLDQAKLGRGPAIPFAGAFTEVNVRLYGVDQRGRRGVVFLSLEASSFAAVLAARVRFALPYKWSHTSLTAVDGAWEYTAERHHGRGGMRMVAKPSTQRVVGDATADFLTSRWGLFTSGRKGTVFLPNQHEPWPLFEAQLITLEDSLLERAGLRGVATRAPDSVLYSPGVTSSFGDAR